MSTSFLTAGCGWRSSPSYWMDKDPCLWLSFRAWHHNPSDVDFSNANLKSEKNEEAGTFSVYYIFYQSSYIIHLWISQYWHVRYMLNNCHYYPFCKIQRRYILALFIKCTVVTFWSFILYMLQVWYEFNSIFLIYSHQIS